MPRALTQITSLGTQVVTTRDATSRSLPHKSHIFFANNSRIIANLLSASFGSIPRKRLTTEDFCIEEFDPEQ